MQVLIEVPQLRVRDQVIRGLKLQSNIVNHAANFTLDSERHQYTCRRTRHHPVERRLHRRCEPRHPDNPDSAIGRAIYVPSQAGNVTGQTEVHATLRGPLKDKTRLEAHLVIPQLAVNYQNSIQLAASRRFARIMRTEFSPCSVQPSAARAPR